MARRSPSQYNWSKQQFDETIMTKHYTAGRNRKIGFVVAHHMTIVGKGTGSANDACYRTWQSRQASAHYGVDGNYVRQFVWDKNAAWAAGSGLGNHAGISIEHANSTAGPKWQVSETTWKNGAKLAAYLHRAHGLGRPTSTNGGRGGTLRKHSSFYATACPGPFFDSIWSRYVAEAQRVYDVLAKGGTPTPSTPTKKEWYEDMDKDAKDTIRRIMRQEIDRRLGDVVPAPKGDKENPNWYAASYWRNAYLVGTQNRAALAALDAKVDALAKDAGTSDETLKAISDAANAGAQAALNEMIDEATVSLEVKGDE